MHQRESTFLSKWRAGVGPVLLMSLLIILMFLYKPEPRPIIAPPWAIPGWFHFEWSPSTGEPRPTPAPVSGSASQHQHLTITSADGLYAPEESIVLADEIQQSFAYVSGRFEQQPTDAISVFVGHEPSCALNGIAYTDERRVQVFTCPDLPRSRAVNILAHEFVHQLAHDRYGPQHLQADLILSEGIATYGAGTYWLGDKPDFKTFVRETYYDHLLPLATTYVGRPIADMNKLYYQWASFSEFLITTHGREKFDAVYVTGSQTPGSADYAAIYGDTLEELETQWLAWLET